MTTHRPTAPFARGLTMVEVLIASLVLLAMATVLLPMLGSGLRRSGVMISANNLRTLAQGYAAYEASWGGRQFSYLREEMGDFSSCASYAATTCPPQVFLGEEGGGGFWGYWIRGSLPQCTGWPGNCSNWMMMVPLPLGGSSGLPADASPLGSVMLPNARGPREYVTTRFFDPVYYSPNDTATYGMLSGAGLLSAAAEFPGSVVINLAGSFFSSYAYSPAALWQRCVLRPASEGGAQLPGSCPGSYVTPTASQASYPELKTRMIEWRWCQDAPRILNPESAPSEPYRFNAGPQSRPGALFFDGHVSFVPMAAFAEDDAMALTQNGQDGLWSRDTAYGKVGVFGEVSIDGFVACPNFLTTGGITGRDLLHAR